jgi:nitrate reductase gamma subunit
MGADAETLTAVLARLQAQRYAIPVSTCSAAALCAVSTCSAAAVAALCTLPLRRRHNHMLSCAAVPRPYAVSL